MLRSSKCSTFARFGAYSFQNRGHAVPIQIIQNQQRYYSLDTPPEELSQNVPLLRDNIDMKNISLAAQNTGRSSVSGIRATVFGASSVLGKHIVNQLGQIGSQVVLPYRGDGTEMKDLKLMGDLGQIVPLPYQIRDKRSVERVIKDSNVVINCISKRRESCNFSFHDTHVNATHMIARTAAELGVDRFIQVSVANAQPDSPSRMFRSKWQGEQVARAFYPEATIIRPGYMFGFGDWFFEKWAWVWSLMLKRPKIINGQQMIQPCHYLDVARAISTCILDPIHTAGNTYEIYGNVCAKKLQFFERVHEVLMCEPTYKRTYRDWNPQLLGAIYAPFYPVQKHMQRWVDFFRSLPNFEFTTHEDVQQTIPDQFADISRLREEGILTLDDMGLKAEDYWYWEAKCLEKFFDRMVPPMEDISSPRKQVGWGGAVPTTDFRSFHSVSLYGYRKMRKGMYNREWHSADMEPYDWEKYEPQFPVGYGSNIDGETKYQAFIERYNKPGNRKLGHTFHTIGNPYLPGHTDPGGLVGFFGSG